MAISNYFELFEQFPFESYYLLFNVVAAEKYMSADEQQQIEKLVIEVYKAEKEDATDIYELALDRLVAAAKTFIAKYQAKFHNAIINDLPPPVQQQINHFIQVIVIFDPNIIQAVSTKLQTLADYKLKTSITVQQQNAEKFEEFFRDIYDKLKAALHNKIKDAVKENSTSSDTDTIIPSRLNLQELLLLYRKLQYYCSKESFPELKELILEKIKNIPVSSDEKAIFIAYIKNKTFCIENVFQLALLETISLAVFYTQMRIAVSPLSLNEYSNNSGDSNSMIDIDSKKDIEALSILKLLEEMKQPQDTADSKDEKRSQPAQKKPKITLPDGKMVKSPVFGKPKEAEVSTEYAEPQPKSSVDSTASKKRKRM